MEREKVVSLQQLSMSFGEKQVLSDITLDVYRGQIIGYIGPNGAGKSTTVKTMLGLLQEYEGRVEIFGEDISQSDGSYKSRIGYVPESAELYENLTAMEYLLFSGELYGLTRSCAEERATKLLQEFELAKAANTRMSGFSKGMKQKVLLISGLLHDPDMLFLDEPLSGLDANSMLIVQEIIELLAAQGKTIFYSSHIMDLVEKISNRIVLLVQGRIVADGTFEQLKEMSEQGTLSDIFNQLTGFTDHEERARKIVSFMQDGNLNETV